jgi:hypothetical protein
VVGQAARRTTQAPARLVVLVRCPVAVVAGAAAEQPLAVPVARAAVAA